MEVLEQAKGSGRKYGRTITSDGRTAVTTFLGTETLTPSLWRGDDLAPITLSASTATWDNAAAGTWTLYVAAADIAALEVGEYPLRVLLTGASDGIPREILRAALRVLPAAGSGTLLPVYCTYDQMRKFAGGWLDTLRAKDTGQTGFAEERAEGRSWLHRQVMARARKAIESQAARHGPVLAVDPITITEGYDAGPTWGPSIYPDTTVRDQLDDIQDALDDNRLMVGAIDNSAVVRLSALYALHLICARQFTPGMRDNGYREMARDYKRDAVQGLLGWVAWVDVDGDGTPEREFK